MLLHIYLNSSHNIHQRVRFIPETSNFFNKWSQIAAGETDHLQLQLPDFKMNYLSISELQKSITVFKKTAKNTPYIRQILYGLKLYFHI